MKKILLVLSVMLVLVSCGGGYNPPNDTTGNVYASFEYEIVQPLSVVFYNTSKKAKSYYWDFGDGTYSREENPVHKFDKKGVYNVVMTATGNGGKQSSCQAQIMIVEPTKCYITGIVYEKVPYNNEYYNIRFTDDYLLFETLYFKTNWVLLSSANIPYSYEISNKQLDLSMNKFVIRLYTNTNNSGTGTEVESWKVLISDLKSKYPTKITGTTKDAIVSLLLEWE